MKAVFLDRDGVITADPPHFAHKPYQFSLIPRAAEAICILNDLNFKVVVVSNQSGIALGYYTTNDAIVYNDLMLAELKKEEAHIDKIYFCPHHPEGIVAEYKLNCRCRKPNSGMLRDAERDLNIDPKKSYLVGDKMSDIKAGKSVGCKTILVLTGHGKEEFRKITSDAVPYCIVEDLYEAARRIQEWTEQ
jgi:D,D-heptose 1,7-bisphosphate phosphatase